MTPSSTPPSSEFLSFLAGGPMIPRTHCYCQGPSVYEVFCPANEAHKITWSEFEGRIWCFDCQKDYNAGRWGIFDGPIPIEVSHSLGIFFDRINLKTQEIVKEGIGQDEYNATWVRTPELTAYEKMVDEMIYPPATKEVNDHD